MKATEHYGRRNQMRHQQSQENPRQERPKNGLDRPPRASVKRRESDDGKSPNPRVKKRRRRRWRRNLRNRWSTVRNL